ncbi:MAG: HAMP domain-containing sensor histidine kinase [Mobilitalea sp.]
MDWIEEKLENLKQRFRNLSIRKALAVYIVLTIAIVVILYALTLGVCERWDKIIWAKYYNILGMDNKNINFVYYQDLSVVKGKDKFFVQLIDFIQTWSIFIYSLAGIIGIPYLFYRNKLKTPFRILSDAMNKVGKNELDTPIYYEGKDEMSKLCQSFDYMRKQMILNNQEMWDVMEEQKRLNAAFAHDLRTPLTVLRGYTDFLNLYVPEGKINEEKLLSTLSLMSNQLQRLEQYSNTMKSINSLEELPVNKSVLDLNKLVVKINEMLVILKGEKSVKVTIQESLNKLTAELLLDENIFMEVFENLISNAFRYSIIEIEVILSYDAVKQQVLLSVADDGKGLTSKELLMAAKPYYTGEGQNSKHFGIGLYICKLLCEKHGGYLSIANRMEQGAVITAAFSIEKIN